MSVFHNNALIGAGAGTGEVAAAEYVIPKSLRFNSGDSAYLSRADSSGNQRTFTVAFWIKKLKAQGEWPVIFSSSADSNNQFTLRWNNDRLQIYALSGGNYGIQLTPSRKFRDYSAWFHVVISVDTTASTASDRVKVYFNGAQHTSGFDFTTSYPSQNESLKINVSGQTVNIGRRNYDAAQYADFLLADFQFVDGQALAPTDFGETRSSDGVWVPKEYTGFGTNPNDGTTWSDSLTTNAGDNFDSSGAKTKAFDGSTSTKAYTANNSDGTTQNTSYIQLNSPKAFTGNLKVICDNGNAVYDVTGGGSTLLATNNTGSDGALIDCGTVTSADKIRVLMAGGSRPAIAAIYIDGNALLDDAADNSFHLNFSDSSTNEALGFDSAPTTPDPDPKKGMDVVTWTGNGTAGTNIGGLGFEPDFVWIKRRNAAYGHVFSDSVRGFGATGWAKQLIGNSTEAENSGAVNTIRSFNPDGFTLGTDGGVNLNSSTYVGWCWRAGGPAVANTDGDITSQVSVNTDYGFSIVSYTASGTRSDTIGHGLSAAPEWIIVKNRDQADDWYVYHVGTDSSNPEAYYLELNDTAGRASFYSPWDDTLPTSSVFSVGVEHNVNASGEDYIAYCWTPVAGYSKFGSYTGSGASGKKITTGFKPRFLLIKRTSTTGYWNIVDSERGGGEALHPNLSNSTSSGGPWITFNDDGFTLTTTGDGYNDSGAAFVYAAFADRPGNNWDVNNIVTNEGLTTSKTQFDVVTYTGNGGTQKIGGPVYSDGWSGSINSTNGAAASFDGNDSTFTRSEISATATWTAATSIPFTTLRLRGAVDSGNGTIQVNGVDVTSQFTANSATLNTRTISGVTSPLTSIKLIGNASSQPRIAFVEIDGTV